MHILIVSDRIIPVFLYGGAERVLWSLGKELVKLGHKVTYLVKEGSSCHFAPIIPIDKNRDIIDQIPNDIDIVHFNFVPTAYVVHAYQKERNRASRLSRIACDRNRV